MGDDSRVIAALDDLARELLLYLQRTGGAALLREDPQGSLYEALKSLETTVSEQDGGDQRAAGMSVQDAVNALPPQQRELLALHLGDGLTCLEIAKRSKRSRQAVLLDLVKAYGHLRLQLGGDYLASIYDRDGRT